MTTIELNDLKTDIIVIFKQIVANKITAGDKGRALFLYKNENLETNHQITTYKSAILSLEDEKLEGYIKQLFKGGCKKVIACEYKTELADFKTAIDEILPEFDWIMSTDADIQTDIKTYAIENNKFAMVYNIKADSIKICSISNPKATIKNDDGSTKDITGLELIPIVGGVACGCPYNMSISYKVFDELSTVQQPDEYNYGQLTLYPEEEGIRLANACNTLQTLNSDYTEDMKSLAIAEGMARVEIDIVKAFRTGYKGKYKNSYDNQCLFYAAIKHGYFKELEALGILDPNYNNNVYTDIEAQRNAWLAAGKKEAEDWTDEEVCKYTYKNMIYMTLDVKFLDAIEGMKMTVEMF